MAFPTGKLNNYMWVAADNTERDAIGTDDSLAVGDRCVNLTSGAVDICLTAAASSSTWEEGPTATATGWTFPAALVVGSGAAVVATVDSGTGRGGWAFDNATNVEHGGIFYDGGGADRLFLRARNGDRMGLHDAAFFPVTDDQLFLGGGSNNFKAVYVVDGITAPGTPSSGAVIYVDTADGDLKVKFSDAFVSVIGAGS